MTQTSMEDAAKPFKDFMVHQARTLAALTEISSFFSSTADFNEVAHRCLGTLANNLDLEKGTVLMPTTDRSQLIIKASNGFSQEEIRSSVYKLEGTLVGKVFSTGMAMALPDILEMEDLPIPRQSRLRSKDDLYRIGFIAVPVELDRRPIGVITAQRSSESTTMVDEDVKVMKIVASLLSQTIRLENYIQDEKQRLEEENRELHAELEEKFQPNNLLCHSSAMELTLAMVKRVAGTDASVLLRGESGTGKTLLARVIHYSSKRKKGPFLIVNCAALPANLIESELFGHERGAFTGATSQRIGRFEAADQGTLFLDEIAEVPLETQAKLLKIIQDGTYERVGSSKTRTTDVRIICATNANLEESVQKKLFREDLYYRLMVVPVNVPALRHRKEDILPLVSYFLKKFTRKYDKRIILSREALEFLETYHWPGNVRELEHTIERTVVLAGQSSLGINDIPLLHPLGDMIQEPKQEPKQEMGNTVRWNSQDDSAGRRPYERIPLKQSEVHEAMENARGIQTHAARMLGVSLRQLRYALQKFGISAEDYRV